MAVIPAGQKFHTVSSSVSTENKGSAQANSNREVFTMQDIEDSVGGGLVTSLTTIGDSGAATLVAGVLNIPTPNSAPLVWSAQLFQSTTGNPAPQTRAVDTLIGNFGGGFRDVEFTRTGVGTYKAKVIYTANNTSVTKLTLVFGDSICRITGSSQGAGGGVSYREWTFETPGFDGVLSDGLLLGNNGGYTTITLYS
tara:strand:+ start:76 stop:663 length:588 start_codon:yes stop_codon:yes gene_type:complete